MKKIKFNKKHLIIELSILNVLIIAIVIVVLVINKQEKEDEINNELEIGNFETQIDMTNLENSQIREDGMKINTSSKIAEGIEFNDLLIKDITIESSGDMAVFNASVENNLGKDIEGYIIYLTFLDKSNMYCSFIHNIYPSPSL